MIVKADVMRALEAVPAPDAAPSLAQSAALSDIVIDGGRVSFAISTSPERAAELETVRRAAEAAVRTVAGVEQVMVALTGDQAPRRPPRLRGRLIPDGVRHVVAVASGKGGVGKSTTAANLALALSARGLTVGLLDADVFGPSLPTLFGLSERPQSEGRRIRPLRALGLELMSIGFMVDSGTAMIWRGPMVMSALTQMLRDVEWGTLDVLIVDMPPGTGDAQLTMAQQVRLSGAVIVSTPQDLALADARRGVAMFRKVEVPILGIIENMSYFCCPNCGTRSEPFGHGGARAEAAAQGTPFLGEVPLDARLRESSDAGTPIVAADPDSALSAAYFAVADAMWSHLGGQSTKPPPRIRMD